MRLASYEDFETEGGLYWPPYRDFPFFRERAEFLAHEFSGARILIAGCGWGFTVQHARTLGLDAWGVDASPYALRRARELGLLREVQYGDITNAETLPGLEVDVVVTEDVYPMLTGEEIHRAQGVLHGLTDTVLHYITPAHDPAHPAIVTVLDEAEWRELLAPDRMLRVG